MPQTSRSYGYVEFRPGNGQVIAADAVQRAFALRDEEPHRFAR